MVRYGRKRFHKRKLTTSKILANKSARAQSFQIARINRRISYLAKANRPEVRCIAREFENTFSNDTFSSNFMTTTMSPWIGSYIIDDQASGSMNFEGNFMRTKGYYLRLISQYTDNWRDTIADVKHDASAGYRIVILQQRQASPITESQTQYIQAQDIFNVSTSLTSGDGNIIRPLNSGVNAQFKILYSKEFTINRYHPTRLHRIYIPAKRLLNMTKVVSSSTSSNSAKGRIHICILTGGLHWDVDYTAVIRMTGVHKLYFTDN